MKNKSKLLSFVMAFVFALSCMLPMGGHVVYANGLIFRPTKVEIEGKVPNEGDKFNILLTVKADKTFTVEDYNLGKITVGGDVDAIGATMGGATLIEANDGKYEGAQILITGLTCKKVGGEITVAIEGQGSGTFTLEHPPVSAGKGLELINPGTLNFITDERQQLVLQFKNTSKGPIEDKDAEIQLKIEDKESAKHIKIKQNKFSVGKMSAGETKEIRTTLDILDTITRGVHELSVYVDGVKHTVKLKVDSDFMPPALQVSVNNTTGFQVNKPQAIQVDVKNVGHVAAKNVKVEITPNEKVVVTDGSNVRYINNIDSGKAEKVDVTLQVVDNKAVTIPVQMKLTYIDDLGKTQEDTQTIYINTQTTAFAKELTIKDVKEPSGIFKVGDTFGVDFSIFAEDGAENVTISVKGAEGIVPKSKNMFVINDLSKGGTQNFHVNFTAGNTVATGTHLIEIQVKYQLNNEEVVISQYATVSVDNPKKEEDEEGEVKGKPKVIIGTYASNPVVVKAGEEFELEIGFLNTNNKKSVHNLKANLTIREEGEKNTGSVFTPVNASNTFFIQDLEPGQMVMENITLYTIPSAAPKTYEMTLEMEYEDAEGNAITATENIGIPVEQVTKLEVAEVQIDTVEVGMEAYMTARIYNTGKTNISNVKITTVGEGFDVKENTMFIGALAKGETENYEPLLIPNQGGMLNGQILIEYEDVTGTVQTMVHDFEMEVMEPMVFPEEEMMPPTDMEMSEEGNKGIAWPVMIGVALGALVAAGITALVLKKRRKKLEEMDIDEN